MRRRNLQDKYYKLLLLNNILSLNNCLIFSPEDEKKFSVPFEINLCFVGYKCSQILFDPNKADMQLRKSVLSIIWTEGHVNQLMNFFIFLFFYFFIFLFSLTYFCKLWVKKVLTNS